MKHCSSNGQQPGTCEHVWMRLHQAGESNTRGCMPWLRIFSRILTTKLLSTAKWLNIYLFKIFRVVGEFTDVSADSDVKDAARLYDLLYVNLISPTLEENLQAVRHLIQPMLLWTTHCSLTSQLQWRPILLKVCPQGSPMAHNG